MTLCRIAVNVRNACLVGLSGASITITAPGGSPVLGSATTDATGGALVPLTAVVPAGGYEIHVTRANYSAYSTSRAKPTTICSGTAIIDSATVEMTPSAGGNIGCEEPHTGGFAVTWSYSPYVPSATNWGFGFSGMLSHSGGDVWSGTLTSMGSVWLASCPPPTPVGPCYQGSYSVGAVIRSCGRLYLRYSFGTGCPESTFRRRFNPCVSGTEDGPYDPGFPPPCNPTAWTYTTEVAFQGVYTVEVVAT